MSGVPLWNVQQAVFALLDGDAALGAMVTGVFDHVPEATALPYVTLGEPECADVGGVADRLSEVTLPVEAWSDYAGRKQAEEILDRVAVLLHRQPLSLSGGDEALAVEVVNARVRVPDAGGLTQATARVRVMVRQG